MLGITVSPKPVRETPVKKKRSTPRGKHPEPKGGLKDLLRPNSPFVRMSTAVATIGGGFALGGTIANTIGSIIGVVIGSVAFLLSDKKR